MDWYPLLHPVGPHEPRVYWVRRAVVVVVVVLIVGLAAKLLAGGGSTPATTRSPAATASGPASPRQPTAARTATPSGPPASTAPAGPAPCAPADLTVTAAAAATDYPLGSLPQLSVTVTNKGQRPCTQDLGGTQRTLTVYSGAERIWSSADCASSVPGMTTLLPGKPSTLAVPWNRQRSAAGCPSQAAGTAAAASGTYRLRGQLVGSPPVDGGAFRLS